MVQYAVKAASEMGSELDSEMKTTRMLKVQVPKVHVCLFLCRGVGEDRYGRSLLIH